MIASLMILNASLRTLLSILPHLRRSEKLEQLLQITTHADERGYFTPEEDEALREYFGQYLVMREALFDLIEDLKPLALDPEVPVEKEVQLKAFLLSYTAACLLVNAGYFLVDLTQDNDTLLSKLNEPESRLGIDGNAYTKIYKSLTSPSNAMILKKAYEFSVDHDDQIKAMALETAYEELYFVKEEAQEALPASVVDYLAERVSYRVHSFKKRNMTALNLAVFAVFEFSGRIFAELVNPFRSKDVTGEIIEQARALLQPGDVMITRHKHAVTNLFLPGFWPHGALYVGDEAERKALGIEVTEEVNERWADSLNVLEAQKDGVHLRPLEQTLHVDYFNIIRPQLSSEDVSKALSRALTHEGKLYDFNFDFSRSDRIVCTEVVYRSYQGVGGLEFELTPRAGRYTLSAEDLLQKALKKEGFELVAHFGLKEGEGLIQGEEAHALVEKSMGELS